jgi:hypothetical protein
VQSLSSHIADVRMRTAYCYHMPVADEHTATLHSDADDATCSQASALALLCCLAIVQEYHEHAQRIGLRTLIHKVAKVLRGYNSLLFGSNAFLPPHLWIQIDDSAPAGSSSSAQQHSNVTLHLAMVSLCGLYAGH